MTSTLTIRPTTDDLWAQATAQLSTEERDNIDLSRPDKLNILSDLLKLTEQSQQECIRKRWRYTRKSGETVIFMDLFSKIVKWIDIFKQVGDAAVQYDPVHAALPWAGVRFLLQIAVNDFNKFAFVVEGAASIAGIVCRYAIFEELYLRSASPATDELKRALVQLYAAIMIYLSKAKMYFNQNSAKRIIKSGLLASDLDSYFGAISTAQEIVDRCSALVGMQDQMDRHQELKRLLEHFNSPLKQLSEDFGRVKDGLETSKRTEILRWISPEPYSQHHEQTKKDVLLGTGQWLLSDPVFDKWKKESVSSILWLHGIPGSGKSKLVSIVIEDTMQAFRAGQSPSPAFFYCSRNNAEPTRSSPEAIIASIVRQLSSPQPGFALLPPIVTTYKRREAEGFASGPLRMDESTALIIQLVDYCPLTTIVIDALDECDPDKRADLLEALEEILQKSSRLVKIFVSSRDDQDIVCHLQDYPNLELASDRNMDDISSFVRAETQGLIRRKKLLRFSMDKEGLKDDIIDQVTKGAGGMFRWASLQLQSLCELKTDDAVRERIGQLPAKLEDLYLELYEKFAKYPADADRQITRNALSWLLCGQRRLNSTEFLAALSMSPRRRFGQVTKNQVLDMCCNLVVFDSTLDTFRFAHLSVREFLEKQPDYSSTTANSLVAETCLSALVCFSYNLATERFLSQHRRPSIKEATFSNDLAAYTTIYWATHCQLAADQRTQGALKDLFLSFLSNESAIATWAARLQESPERYTIDYSLYRQFKKLEDTKATSAIALFLACSFDFPEVFADQAAKGSFRADFVNSNGRTAFQVAVRHNSYKVVSIFISDKLTQITKEVVKEAAGSWDGGKDTMMLLLERRGADIQITKEVVIAAARNWNSGKEVITLLLEQREAEVQITEEVVIAAAENWNSGKEVITLLLKQREAEVQITEEVVKAAARNSRSEVMALLLDQRGNEVKITDEVVKAAAEDGCSDVMALLLDQRGDDIKITDEVVKAAARNWSGEVIALLLDRRGDDVKITDEVVKAAARNSRSEVMTLLLDQRGDDVKITDEVVKAAARNSCSEVMTLLLDRRGDNIKITDEVVKAAAGAWSGEVMTLLLDRRGGDVKITDKVVKAVAGNEHSGKEIMAVLLDRRGDDVKITDKVVKAVAGNEESGEEIMTLLLDRRGDNVKITDDIVTAAATSGQERVLRLIDTRLKILSFKEKWFSIARFYNAAQDGDEEMIRGLLVLGIEPDLKNPRNVSPLWRAACCGHFAVVKLLLDTQAVDINVRSIAGRSPLFWAAAKGHEDIVRLLLERHANPNFVDKDGQTPLSMAKQNGHDKVIDLLEGA